MFRANPHTLTHTPRWTRLLLLQQLLVETIDLLDPAAVRVPRNRRVVLAPVRFRQPEELEAYKWVVQARAGCVLGHVHVDVGCREHARGGPGGALKRGAWRGCMRVVVRAAFTSHILCNWPQRASAASRLQGICQGGHRSSQAPYVPRNVYVLTAASHDAAGIACSS